MHRSTLRRTFAAAAVAITAAAVPLASPTSAVDPPAAPGLPSALLRWHGEGGSALGNAVASGHCDVNGDGAADTITGAWFWNKAPYRLVGAAYVVFGGPEVVAGGLDQPATVGAVRIDGPVPTEEGDETGGSVGFAVACVGDVNGDGFADIGISDYQNQRAIIVFGAADFQPFALDALGSRGFVVAGDLATSGNVGYSMAPLGDVNGDGLDDFAVAEIAADTLGRTNNGRIWVIAGQTGIGDVDLTAVAPPGVLMTVDGAVNNERLSVVSEVGDVNGDGLADILLGSYVSTPHGPTVAATGAAYVVFGGATGAVDTAALGSRGFTIAGPARQRDRLGVAVAAAGDVNGDGLADLLIGADGVSNAATGPRNGGAAVVFGAASNATVYTDPLGSVGAYTCAAGSTLGVCADPADVQPRGYWIDGAAADDKAGFSVAGVGDVNGDDVPDLLIGAWSYDPVDPQHAPATMSGAGAVYLVYGKTTTTPQSLAALTAADGFRIDGLAAGDRFGRQVAGVGDVDGNGVADFAAGADFATRPLPADTGLDRAGELLVALMGELATRTSVTAEPATLRPGDALTLRSATTIAGGQPAGAGTVTFRVDGVAVPGCADLPVASDGTASCATTAGAGGVHQVVAAYSGATRWAGSTSAQAPIDVEVPVDPEEPEQPGEPQPPTYELPGGASSYVDVAPCRLVDTRTDADVQQLDATTIRVRAAGVCGVPPGATAVAVSLTMDAAADVGYLTAWPSGGARPEVSSLNYDAGQTRANGAVVPLGDDGSIDVFSSQPGGVLVDVSGAFLPLTTTGSAASTGIGAATQNAAAEGSSDASAGGAAGAGTPAESGRGPAGVRSLADVSATPVLPSAGPVAAGRLVPLAPERLLDTRQSVALGAGATVRVPLPASVPSGASAVAINVTVTQSAGGGYVSAWPAGGAQPEASVVNTDGPEQTRAAGVIVPVSADGIDLYTSVGTQLIVDVTGYFTGAAAAAGTDGLFVPTPPERLLDTRQSGALDAGTTVAVPVPADAADAIALAANVTIVDPVAPGWLVAYPAGAPQPATSTVNASGAGENAASLALVPVAADGVAVYADVPTHVLVDRTGWFTPVIEPTDPEQPGEPGEPVDPTPRSVAYAARNWVPTEYDTCSAALHASYSAIGPDGKRYPTWHAPTVVDPATGRTCTFGHEHGDDPASSDLYDWALDYFAPPGGAAEPGVPFGLASEALVDYAAANAGQVTRHEDHVGHKVFVANDVALVRQSPRGYVTFEDGSGAQVPVECDYLIKTHQGSHSADATTNNAHELFYAVRCNDGTAIAATVMSRFGDPNEYTRSCDRSATITTSGSNLPNGDGGARLIPDRECIERFVLVDPATTAASDIWSLYEVWQSANELRTTGGRVLASFDPWFAVRNPSRYGWSAKNPDGSDGTGATVAAAWEVDAADDGRVNANPWLAICTLPAFGPGAPQSPFDGAERDFYVRTTLVANAGGPGVWYTDPWGANASVTPFAGSIRQWISATDNSTYPTLERQNFGLGTDYGTGQGVHAPN